MVHLVLVLGPEAFYWPNKLAIGPTEPTLAHYLKDGYSFHSFYAVSVKTFCSVETAMVFRFCLVYSFSFFVFESFQILDSFHRHSFRKCLEILIMTHKCCDFIADIFQRKKKNPNKSNLFLIEGKNKKKKSN